jgi:predicted metalloprotease
MIGIYREDVEASSPRSRGLPPLRRIPFAPLVLLLAGTLLATGCATESSGDLGLTFGGERDLDEPISPDTGLDGGEAPASNEVVDAALDDVQSFWSRTYEDLYGEPYEPISGGFKPYGPNSALPRCGEAPLVYVEIAENAFYCPSSDLIAWDAVNLVPDLYEEFGGFTLGIVFAHEFGHAIQKRAGTLDQTIMSELQADCFAGAWTADVDAGNAEHFELTVTDLDRAIAGFLALRDTVGIDQSADAAHGTGFDRIGAFSEGFEQGPERCVEYPDEFAAGNLVIVEVPFTDQADFDRDGNLPLDELGPILLADLENFWTLLFQEQGQAWEPVEVVTLDPAADEVACGDRTFRGDELVGASFYCIDSDTIYVDGANLIPALYDIGDYAVATEVARQYAFAAQARSGNLDNTPATDLQADCLAGLFAYSGFSGNREGQGQELFLSPGDLDEAVIAFLSDSDASDEVSDDAASVATAFARFDAYRAGFMDGISACDALLEDG